MATFVILRHPVTTLVTDFLFQLQGYLLNRTDLRDLTLVGPIGPGTRPPSCTMPRQPTIIWEEN